MYVPSPLLETYSTVRLFWDLHRTCLIEDRLTRHYSVSWYRSNPLNKRGPYSYIKAIYRKCCLFERSHVTTYLPYLQSHSQSQRFCAGDPKELSALTKVNLLFISVSATVMYVNSSTRTRVGGGDELRDSQKLASGPFPVPILS